MKKNEALFKIYDKSLYREKNLVIVQIPIFFVCKDENEHRYLVLLLDFYSDEYLICPITDEDLLLMLTGKITMRRPFVISKELYLVKTGENPDEDAVEEVKYLDLENDILPEENALFEIGEDEGLKEYVFKLKELKFDFDRIKSNAEGITTLAKDLINNFDYASKYADFAVKNISSVAKILIEYDKILSNYANAIVESMTTAVEALGICDNALSTCDNVAVESITTAVQALAEYNALPIMGVNSSSQLVDYKASNEIDGEPILLEDVENKKASFSFSYSSADMETSYYHVDEYISIKVA